MIKAFKCKETEALFKRKSSQRFGVIQKVALRKLLLLEAAERVEDLRIPPGNRLERLFGDRDGQYSIRINDQYRICFRFERSCAVDVEIVDYH